VDKTATFIEMHEDGVRKGNIRSETKVIPFYGAIESYHLLMAESDFMKKIGVL